MRALLDTSAFLWYASQKHRLSPQALGVISDSSNEVLLSAASVWEIAIKQSIGKIDLPEQPEVFFPRRLQLYGLTSLEVSVAHAARVSSLPLLHKDPFDRLLIAQSLIEGLPIVTNDDHIKRYGVDVIW